MLLAGVSETAILFPLDFFSEYVDLLSSFIGTCASPYHPEIQSAPTTNSLASPALFKFYLLEANVRRLVMSGGVEAAVAWPSYFVPIHGALAQHCYHPDRTVRQQALSLLQRILLSIDFSGFGMGRLLEEFDTVIFPLLEALLQPEVRMLSNSSGGQKGVASPSSSSFEETQMRAASMACKFVLQNLSLLFPLDLLDQHHPSDQGMRAPSPEMAVIEAVWTPLLRLLLRFLATPTSSEVVRESIPESLKNMLMVMVTTEVLVPTSPALWTATFAVLDGVESLAGLSHELREMGEALTNVELPPAVINGEATSSQVGLDPVTVAETVDKNEEDSLLVFKNATLPIRQIDEESREHRLFGSETVDIFPAAATANKSEEFHALKNHREPSIGHKLFGSEAEHFFDQITSTMPQESMATERKQSLFDQYGTVRLNVIEDLEGEMQRVPSASSAAGSDGFFVAESRKVHSVLSTQSDGFFVNESKDNPDVVAQTPIGAQVIPNQTENTIGLPNQSLAESFTAAGESEKIKESETMHRTFTSTAYVQEDKGGPAHQKETLTNSENFFESFNAQNEQVPPPKGSEPEGPKVSSELHQSIPEPKATTPKVSSDELHTNKTNDQNEITETDPPSDSPQSSVTCSPTLFDV